MVAKKRKSTETALAPKNQELGLAIIAEAEKRVDTEDREAVIVAAREIMNFAGDARRGEIHMRETAEFYEKKLRELRAGNFTLDRLYARHPRIVFTDRELNLNR